MKFKHTPGPWKAGERHVSAPETEDYLAVDVSLRGGNRDANKANARLIAASPDLLLALADLLERYTELVNSGDGGFWDCEEEQEVIAARAAIHKATGRPA